MSTYSFNKEQEEIYEGLSIDIPQDVAESYAALTGDDDLDDIEEAYEGHYSSDKEFAMDMADNLGAIDRDLSWPHTCIDWEWAADELMQDYMEIYGYYFRCI
jgi:antirestriction protein